MTKNRATAPIARASLCFGYAGDIPITVSGLWGLVVSAGCFVGVCCSDETSLERLGDDSGLAVGPEIGDSVSEAASTVCERGSIIIFVLHCLQMALTNGFESFSSEIS
jgi:hypothetical protein